MNQRLVNLHTGQQRIALALVLHFHVAVNVETIAWRHARNVGNGTFAWGSLVLLCCCCCD
jgi:hypothetical protein